MSRKMFFGKRIGLQGTRDEERYEPNLTLNPDYKINVLEGLNETEKGIVCTLSNTTLIDTDHSIEETGRAGKQALYAISFRSFVRDPLYRDKVNRWFEELKGKKLSEVQYKRYTGGMRYEELQRTVEETEKPWDLPVAIVPFLFPLQRPSSLERCIPLWPTFEGLSKKNIIVTTERVGPDTGTEYQIKGIPFKFTRGPSNTDYRINLAFRGEDNLEGLEETIQFLRTFQIHEKSGHHYACNSIRAYELLQRLTGKDLSGEISAAVDLMKGRVLDFERNENFRYLETDEGQEWLKHNKPILQKYDPAFVKEHLK